MPLLTRLRLSPSFRLPGFLTGKGGFCWIRCPPSSRYFCRSLCIGHYNADISQAAKDVQESQFTLADIFERIETFFRRLEIYTEVPVTTEMMNIVIQIMVEVLSVLGIATKEIKEGRTSEYSQYKCVAVD